MSLVLGIEGLGGCEVVERWISRHQEKMDEGLWVEVADQDRVLCLPDYCACWEGGWLGDVTEEAGLKVGLRLC